MAFIREKTSRGRKYFYLVESRRIGGKVRQKTLAYLGPADDIDATLDSAIAFAEREAAHHVAWANLCEAVAEKESGKRAPVRDAVTGGLLPAPFGPRLYFFENGGYWISSASAPAARRQAARAAARAQLLIGLRSA
jgi:hypothetical protein